MSKIVQRIEIYWSASPGHFLISRDYLSIRLMICGSSKGSSAQVRAIITIYSEFKCVFPAILRIPSHYPVGEGRPFRDVQLHLRSLKFVFTVEA